MTRREAGSPDMDSLAARMLGDYDTRVPGTVFGEGLRLSLDEAQQLQGAVARLRMSRGERVAGYKIGCVCPGNQQRLGVSHPVWGRLWSTEQHASGVRLAKSRFAELAIEGELAVVLARDLPAATAQAGRVHEAIAHIRPVIELHQLVFRGGHPRGAELIANNAIHAGVVCGAGVPASATPLSSDLWVCFDGRRIDGWSAVRWPEDVLAPIGWLAQHLEAAGLRLEAGQTILTGALGPPLPVAAVRHVQVGSSAFGDVEAWLH